MKILFNDEFLTVVHKPPQLDVYADSSNQNSVITLLSKRFPGSRFFPVHRLDKDTEGLVVLAKDAKTASYLLRDFEARKIKKTYEALVRGNAPFRGLIKDPLVDRKTRQSLRALTAFRKIRNIPLTDSTGSYLEVQPHTGRFHQIRRHLSMQGLPIVGDSRYGPKKISIRPAATKDPTKSTIRSVMKPVGEPLCLCAVSLDFFHPRTRKRLRLVSRPSFLNSKNSHGPARR